MSLVSPSTGPPTPPLWWKPRRLRPIRVECRSAQTRSQTRTVCPISTTRTGRIIRNATIESRCREPKPEREFSGWKTPILANCDFGCGIGDRHSARPVARVSQPAVSPISQSGGRGIHEGRTNPVVRRLEVLRYSRFGNLRHRDSVIHLAVSSLTVVNENARQSVALTFTIQTNPFRERNRPISAKMSADQWFNWRGGLSANFAWGQREIRRRTLLPNAAAKVPRMTKSAPAAKTRYSEPLTPRTSTLKFGAVGS